MKKFLGALAVAVAAFLPQGNAAGFSDDLLLLSAKDFAVLAATTVTSANMSVLTGNLGVYPGTAFTGFPPGIVHGLTYGGGAVAQQAQADAQAAFTALNNQTSIQNLSGLDLGGRTLGPGVRNFDAGANLTGTLTLDGGGNPNARFDFLMGTTLVSTAGSGIVLINGADARNVFWSVGSSATLGADTSFLGSIIAHTSISMGAGASLRVGRLLALGGAVTLDNNVVAVPEASAFWPLALCFPVFGVWQWRAGRRRNAALS